MHLSSGTSEMNQIQNEQIKIYRGACTVKDWSSSTVSMKDFCPAGKVPYRFLLSLDTGKRAPNSPRTLDESRKIIKYSTTVDQIKIIVCASGIV